jgi:hypothetical protein
LDEAQRGPYAFALEDVAVIHKPRLMTELYQRMADVLQGPQAVETAPARAADPEAD